jgi:hypothetical protein
MDNQIFKKFTPWNFLILLVLIFIAIPSILGVLETIFSQNFEKLAASLFISAVVLYGILKYSKKLISNIKNLETKKGAIIMSIILIIIAIIFFQHIF